MILVNLSNLPWVPGRLKRNQALFQRLLGGDSAFEEGRFVDPPGIAPGGLRKYASTPAVEVTTVDGDSRVRLVRSSYALPHWRVPGGAAQWARVVAERVHQDLGGRRYVLWMNSAGKLQCELAKRLAPGAELRVFDSSDDFASWEGNGFRKQLEQIVALANVVTCVNAHVADTIAHPRKIVFRNCTDYESFQNVEADYQLPPWYPKPGGAVYIGFIGGIHETRADAELLTALFRRFPAWHFLFVGYTDNPRFVERLTSFGNVQFVPEIPYRELGNVIRGFDVAIVPHRDNAVTRGNDLLKVLDYFACGVPVVSTRCSGVEEYGDALHIADTAQEFGDCLEELVSGRRTHDPTKGEAIARERSWAVQAPKLAAEVLGGLTRAA